MRVRSQVRTALLASLLVAAIAGVEAPAGASPAWNIVASPNPKGSDNAGLNGLACPSETFCMAVGSAIAPGQNNPTTLTERWDGARWSLVASPSGGQNAGLTGVSCTNATNCTAVGSYSNGKAPHLSPLRTLIEHWNGRSWSIVASPNPAGPDPAGTDNYLSGVACPSTTFCVAVGNGNAAALIEQWDGRSWSIVASPNHNLGDYNLFGVSCTSASFCMAVGTSVRIWNGSRWSIANGATDADLSGVSCTSARDCIAVGNTPQSTLFQLPTSGLLEHWNGSRWSSVTLDDWELGGVSCTSASNCYAVGSTDPGTLVERWDGASWSLVASPNPDHADSTDLSGVSCASATRCFAVGGNFANIGRTRNGIGTTLIERGPAASSGPRPNQPIVGMGAGPLGGGYWLVASDGGIFTFGDAHFYGSAGTMASSTPIVGMTGTTPFGRATHWLVAADGTVFGFGNAQLVGVPGALGLQYPIIGIVRPQSGRHYLLAASDGETFGF